VVPSHPGQIVLRELISKISFTKIGLVEWLKVKALSSSLSTSKKERKERYLKYF
jgi:plasmid maintenance system antidote protein VapI